MKNAKTKTKKRKKNGVFLRGAIGLAGGESVPHPSPPHRQPAPCSSPGVTCLYTRVQRMPPNPPNSFGAAQRRTPSEKWRNKLSAHSFVSRLRGEGPAAPSDSSPLSPNGIKISPTLLKQWMLLAHKLADVYQTTLRAYELATFPHPHPI